MTISRTHAQRLLIFHHSRKPFLRYLQNHNSDNEVTPCVLLVELLQSMWKLSVTKPNISHPLPVSSRLEMNGFTFMKILLQSRPKSPWKNIRENPNKFFIYEVTYKRKLIRHWRFISWENVIQTSRNSLHC